MEKITSLEQFSIRQLKMMRKKLKKKKRDPMLIAQLNDEIKGKQVMHAIGKNELSVKKLQTHQQRLKQQLKIGVDRVSPT